MSKKPATVAAAKPVKAKSPKVSARSAVGEPARQDHEVPSPKEVANNAAVVAHAEQKAKAAKATKGKPDAKASGAKSKKPAAAKPAKEPKAKKLSGLDAAAQVLKAFGKPMATKDMVEAMTAKGLWSSKSGKTPQATIYAAIIREIVAKKKESRFKKTDRGLFIYNAD